MDNRPVSVAAEVVSPRYLAVPGARLCYEISGTGPLLLLIPGANGDVLFFQPMQPFLAASYTVVTYDRRGYSRSTLVGPPDPAPKLEVDVDDAQRLLAHLSPQCPATIFGTGSGAIVALALLQRHPAAVRRLVVHEPPLTPLLPDAAEWTRFYDQLTSTNRQQGMAAVLPQFAERLRHGTDAQLMQRARCH